MVGNRPSYSMEAHVVRKRRAAHGVRKRRAAAKYKKIHGDKVRRQAGRQVLSGRQVGDKWETIGRQVGRQMGDKHASNSSQEHDYIVDSTIDKCAHVSMVQNIVQYVF